MTKAQRRKIFNDLFQRFAVFFTIVILLLSAAGLILARVNSKENVITKLFAYENPGLPYSYIAILAGIIFFITLIFFLAGNLIRRNKNRYDALFKSHHIYHKKKMT
jgi:phosphotransferase system  glucose/maltose/N-acetylglucosamine-specific IIC component